MKTRIISGVALVVLGLILLLVLPTWVTAVVTGLGVAVAAYELLYQTGLMRHPRLVVYAMVSGFSVSIWTWAGRDRAWGLLILLALYTALFAELMASHIKLSLEKISLCFVAGWVIPYLFSSIVSILCMPKMGRFYVLLPILMAVVPDSGAYFAGKFFGKHKLAPVISPKKTIEGAIGGVAAGILGMLLYCLVLWLGFGLTVNFGYAAIYGLVGSLASILGDLSFSVIKRQTGIKDYGNLIPGHGGVLDRFDSWCVVAPLCEALLLIIPVAVR